MRRLAFLASLGLALLATAACTSSEKEVLKCPTVAFLNEVDQIRAFREGAGTDLSDVIYEAQFGKLAAVCDFGRRAVEIDTSFEIIATRGPADSDRSAPIKFFVAIMDPAGEVVAKEIYDAPIPFADNRRRVGRREQVEPLIPYPSERTAIKDYKVFIGFQLTEEQLRYNRTTKR
jgi:hypothetical protein